MTLWQTWSRNLELQFEDDGRKSGSRFVIVKRVVNATTTRVVMMMTVIMKKKNKYKETVGGCKLGRIRVIRTQSGPERSDTGLFEFPPNNGLQAP